MFDTPTSDPGTGPHARFTRLVSPDRDEDDKNDNSDDDEIDNDDDDDDIYIMMQCLFVCHEK